MAYETWRCGEDVSWLFSLGPLAVVVSRERDSDGRRVLGVRAIFGR